MPSYRTDPLMGVQTPSQLSKLFFSQENMNNIQTELRYRVFKRTGVTIENQDETSLKVVMRGIFLQEADHYPSNLTQQIKTLNEKVLTYAVDNVSSNVLQQVHYIKQINSNPVPMDYPAHQSQRGYRTFDLVPGSSHSKQ